jgi:hypothetical protein
VFEAGTVGAQVYGRRIELGHEEGVELSSVHRNEATTPTRLHHFPGEAQEPLSIRASDSRPDWPTGQCQHLFGHAEGFECPECIGPQPDPGPHFSERRCLLVDLDIHA